MIFYGTITIEWNDLGQPLRSMVFDGFGVWQPLETMVFDGFPPLVQGWNGYLGISMSKGDWCTPKSVFLFVCAVEEQCNCCSTMCSAIFAMLLTQCNCCLHTSLDGLVSLGLLVTMLVWVCYNVSLGLLQC